MKRVLVRFVNLKCVVFALSELPSRLTHHLGTWRNGEIFARAVYEMGDTKKGVGSGKFREN